MEVELLEGGLGGGRELRDGAGLGSSAEACISGRRRTPGSPGLRDCGAKDTKSLETVRDGWAHLGVRGGGGEEHEGADEERVLERAAGAVAVEGDGAARRRVAGAAPGGCRVGREGLLAATADRQTRDEA